MGKCVKIIFRQLETRNSKTNAYETLIYIILILYLQVMAREDGKIWYKLVRCQIWLQLYGKHII